MAKWYTIIHNAYMDFVGVACIHAANWNCNARLSVWGIAHHIILAYRDGNEIITAPAAEWDCIANDKLGWIEMSRFATACACCVHAYYCFWAVFKEVLALCTIPSPPTLSRKYICRLPFATNITYCCCWFIFLLHSFFLTAHVSF